jgi:thymidylate synthase ThyX
MAYGAAMKSIDGNYKSLIKHGAEIEDARGILPTNIHTNIVAKMNMRTWVELIRKRSSPRTQGEYRAVLDAMSEEVRKVHPWIDLFINRTFDRAAKELDLTIKSLVDHRQIAPEMGTAIIKLIDQMRGKS